VSQSRLVKGDRSTKKGKRDECPPTAARAALWAVNLKSGDDALGNARGVARSGAIFRRSIGIHAVRGVMNAITGGEHSRHGLLDSLGGLADLVHVEALEQGVAGG
jgi:hypothetical protein